MKVNLVHLYGDLMNLYGEYANLLVLRRHLLDLGCDVTLTRTDPSEAPPFADADLIYMGAGTERSARAALAALTPHTHALHVAHRRGALLLFTGSAFPLLGKSITDADGTTHSALAFAPFTTHESRTRITTDVYGECTLFDAPIVGFMNKCSRTEGIETPLLRSLSLGFGNDAEGASEGYVGENIIATHLSGPLLVKNPAMTMHIVRHLFARAGETLPTILPEYPHEQESYAVTESALRERFGG